MVTQLQFYNLSLCWVIPHFRRKPPPNFSIFAVSSSWTPSIQNTKSFYTIAATADLRLSSSSITTPRAPFIYYTYIPFAIHFTFVVMLYSYVCRRVTVFQQYTYHCPFRTSCVLPILPIFLFVKIYVRTHAFVCQEHAYQTEDAGVHYESAKQNFCYQTMTRMNRRYE